MPRLRCPYCHQAFAGEPAPSHCPHCRKAFVVPAKLRKTTFRERQRMRDKIARESDRQRRAHVALEDFRLGRKPGIVGGILLFLLIIGGLLVSRANRLTTPDNDQQASREARAERELDALRAALQQFREATGRYPTPEEGLKALVIDPGVPGWSGNYVTMLKPDPWRNHYVYALANDHVDVRSAGPDGRPFTSDDIVPAEMGE